MRLVLGLALSLALPTGLMAAGSSDSSAPATPKCEDGQVYDQATKTCVDAKDSRLDDDDRYETVRALAHAGRHSDAQRVLAAMKQDDDRTLTYLGFTTRRMGDMAGGMALYARALDVNPDNLLARSYMGQALVEQGRVADALSQLREIRARGGEGTWAEASLRRAIATGQTYSY
jgi:thioredoxin-like negative regulator of GroEL